MGYATEWTGGWIDQQQFIGEGREQVVLGWVEMNAAFAFPLFAFPCLPPRVSPNPPRIDIACCWRKSRAGGRQLTITITAERSANALERRTMKLELICLTKVNRIRIRSMDVDNY